ncbi:M23 family metallopeptidase [Pedobacter sp. JY14-1]|uniref:M23 family metallopeptidase n=1 Tax=Pedobacter sp. JY14-1 TaxID=3034151 RepID=UPI0023E0B9FA|nr:M23 family metallopeptidase [Pedobacter sp. JY14-1]
MKLPLLFILFAGAYLKLNAQHIYSGNKYPLTDFRRPLDITPPALAGSFGELRANHFHSGIDFRTNQRQGYPVYAIADGYISRLRVQNSGFGLALYINHPNGYTSVYGHLQRFNPKIAREVKALQYQKKSYEIDEFPNALLIPVHKGEIIAYSGNTGSSGGPHLHFEIRDTKNEATINPQFFGIDIPDDIPPVIYAIYSYRLGHRPFNEFTPKQLHQVTGSAGNYRLSGPALQLSGETGFGIVTTDRHNGASGLNGVYSIELQLDGTPVCISALERFQFENSKAINAHIDYPAWLNTKRSIQKSFVDPGNPLGIYSNLVNNGRMLFNDGKLHELKYIVTDAKGNKSSLSFQVQAGADDAPLPAAGSSGQPAFSYATANEYNTEDIRVIIPKGSLYDDLSFVYKKLPNSAAGAYSGIHQVHNKLTPLHNGFQLWIRADAVPEKYREKALIVNTNRVSQGGAYEDGYIKTSPRNFGSFFIALDTIAPSVSPLNISEGKRMAGLSKMSFRISDNLSGIKSFNGYIDGRWVLMEFDTKTAGLWHTFDENTGPGKHRLELVVTDMKDNTRNYSITFYR